MKRLERVFSRTGSPLLRISELVHGDGRALYEQALERGWEGLIAKQAESTYKSGKRTPDWRKLKILHEQEFVIGGYTEPEGSRKYFGALLVGFYEGKTLKFAGRVGTGFSEKLFSALYSELNKIRIDKVSLLPSSGHRSQSLGPRTVRR